MLCSYQERECSYLDELTSYHGDFRRMGDTERWDNYEQIVPDSQDNLADLEASLYLHGSSMKIDMSPDNLIYATMVNVRPPTELSATLPPPTYDDSVRSLQEEELRILTSSPTSSDLSLAGFDTEVIDITEDGPGETSELLSDIMECIESVDTTANRQLSKKGINSFL